MPTPEKLSERNDEAGKITLELTKDMIRKMIHLTDMRDKLIKQKRDKIEQIERSFKKKLFSIERDIDNFENAIKKVAGANEYRKLRKDYIESLKQPKVDEQKESEEINNENQM
jgi:hypothetical protein